MPRYEFRKGSSNKFWEIALDGTSFTTRWGKIGAAGQQKKKRFATADAAKREHDKLVAEKLAEGYGLAAGAGTVLRYELGDDDASDACTIEVDPPSREGLRFVLEAAGMAPLSVHVPASALEDAPGVLRFEQNVVYAGDEPVADGQTVSGWTAPFLVPRRFIRELLRDDTSELKIFAEAATFTRAELDAKDNALAKKCGLPLLKAASSEMTLLVSADPSTPLLLSRDAGEPMVTWLEGKLTKWPRAEGAPPKKAAARDKKGRAPDLVSTLLHDPEPKKRVLAAKKLAAAPSPAAARALLDAAWTDASSEVRATAASAPRRETRDVFAQAALVILDEIFASGPLARAWDETKSDRAVQWSIRTLRESRITSLVHLLGAEDVATRPATLEKIRTIACTFSDWEAIYLRVLISSNLDDRGAIDRSLADLHSDDPALADVARDALYTLFHLDSAAARARIAGDLRATALATAEGQRFAERLVSGFGPPEDPAWVQAIVQIWKHVPSARTPIQKWVRETIYRPWGSTDVASLLRDVGEHSHDWQLLVANIGDERLFEQLGEASIPDAALTGDVLEAWMRLDVLGDFGLGEADRLRAALARQSAKEAARIVGAVMAGCEQIWRYARLWKYVRERREPAFRGIVGQMRSKYAGLDDADRDDEILDQMATAT